MVGNLKIRHKRLAEALDFHVLRVILADGHAGVDDLRNDLHPLLDLLGVLLLQRLQLHELFGNLGDFGLGGLGLVLLALLHQPADLLGEHLALIAQGIGALHCLAVLAVEIDDLVHQRQFAVLKLAPDVFTHDVGRLADEIDVNHGIPSFLPAGSMQ